MREAIESNPKAVADYQKGKQNAVGFLGWASHAGNRGQANHRWRTRLCRPTFADSAPAEETPS